METGETDSQSCFAQNPRLLSPPSSPAPGSLTGSLPSTQGAVLWDARDAAPCTSKVGGGSKQRRISDAQAFPSG